MKLAYSPTSPYVRKVRVCAMELGLDDRIEMDAVTVLPTQVNGEYQRRNPLGKIPALTLDSGEVIYDSGVICEYLDSLNSSVKLIPHDAKRWTVLTQHQLASGIMDALVLMRYESFLRPEELRWEEWYAGQQRKVFKAIDWLEHDSDWQELSLNLAQIALACALAYWDFRFESMNWKNSHPKLLSWFDNFSQRSSMQATAHQ